MRHAMPDPRFRAGAAAHRASSSWLALPFGRGLQRRARAAPSRPCRRTRRRLRGRLRLVVEPGRAAPARSRRSLQTGSMSQPADRACRARVDDVPVRGSGPSHGQIVGEHYPLKPQLSAQHVANPAPREAGGRRIHRREQHVGHHDRRQAVGDQAPVGGQVRRSGRRASRRSTGRVRCESATTAPCPGKVLGGGRHAGIPHAVHVGHGELRRPPRPSAWKARSPIDLAHPVVEIHARREGDDRPRGHAAPRPSASPCCGRARGRRGRRGRTRGRCGAPAAAARSPARKRCTRPPSWSTATISGGDAHRVDRRHQRA